MNELKNIREVYIEIELEKWIIWEKSLFFKYFYNFFAPKANKAKNEKLKFSSLLKLNYFEF